MLLRNSVGSLSRLAPQVQLHGLLLDLLMDLLGNLNGHLMGGRSGEFSMITYQQRVESNQISCTTLQSMMNAKLSKQRFRHCHENGLIKTIQTIPHNLYVSVKLTSLYCGLRLILVYPNPQ